MRRTDRSAIVVHEGRARIGAIGTKEPRELLMAFNAKLPPGGLRAAVETNLRDKAEQQPLTLEAEPATEQFKTIRLERVDYDGADQSSGNCPVARAIRRALKRDDVFVWVGKVRIGMSVYALPAEAHVADQRWVQKSFVTEAEFELSNKKVTP